MASLESTYRLMVEQRKITDATDLEDNDKDQLKDISKALNKSTKAHAKQAKYLDKLVKKDTNEETDLEEGTWHMPDSPKDMKKIISILGKPLPVGDEENAYEGTEAEVGRKLNALGKAKVPIGDDEFYDEAYMLATKKGPRADLRPAIIDALVRMGMLDKKGTPAAVISALNMAMKSKKEEVNEAMTKSKRRALDKKMFKKVVLNMGEEQVDEIAPVVVGLARTAATAGAAQAGSNIANKLTASHSAKEVKMAIGIASDPRYAKGNMTGAVKAIEKMKKGLSSHPQVAAVLKRQNEMVEKNYAYFDTKDAAVAHAKKDGGKVYRNTGKGATMVKGVPKNQFVVIKDEMTNEAAPMVNPKDQKLDRKFAKLSPRAQSYANDLMRKGDTSEYAIQQAKKEFGEQVEGEVEQVETEPATNKSLFNNYINKLIKGEV